MTGTIEGRKDLLTNKKPEIPRNLREIYVVILLSGRETWKA